MITKYESNCFICGKSVDCPPHHLVLGRGNRMLADQDGLTAPICIDCHRRLHNDGMCCELSRICGQLLYEKNIIEKEGVSADEAREKFRARYHVSYL